MLWNLVYRLFSELEIVEADGKNRKVVERALDFVRIYE